MTLKYNFGASRGLLSNIGQPFICCKMKRFLCLSLLVLIGNLFAMTGTAQWNMLSQPFSGSGTHRIINSKYALFASTDFGLYRSFDTGMTWDLIAFQGQNLSDLEQDSTGHLYVISYDVYVSSDSGMSWISDHNPQTSIAVSPDNKVYGSNGGSGVTVSTDAGLNWTSLTSPIPDKYRIFTLSNGEIGIFSEDGIYRSFDGGHTLTLP